MANKGLDNKISNIIGTKVPQWLIQQLDTRANRNSDDVRSNENLLYLTNKSAWVRLVSSVDINQDRDQKFFERISGINITLPHDLARKFILFGGTSAYTQNNSYELRSGVSFSDTNNTMGGAYGMLGKEEIQKYGYRPMPGIISANIETQGRLGSIRGAIINFKCWDKSQLDIIDALYFKLGFTMFLEWGHTYFYTAEQETILKRTEDFSIVDPFRSISIAGGRGSIPEFPTKEEIGAKISETSRDTEGNYDAMLGMVTNFNFVYNAEGGYDCTLRLMSLGMLGDSIKINNPSTLPNLLQEEIILLDKTLKLLDTPQSDTPPTDTENELPANYVENDLLQILAVTIVKNYDVDKLVRNDKTGYTTYAQIANKDKNLFGTIAFTNYNQISRTALKDFNDKVRRITNNENTFMYAPSNFNRVVKSTTGALNFKLGSTEYYDVDYATGDEFIIGKKGIRLSPKNTYKNISLDISYLKRRFLNFYQHFNSQGALFPPADATLKSKNFDIDKFKNIHVLESFLISTNKLDRFYSDFTVGYDSPVYGLNIRENPNYKKPYFFSIRIDKTLKTSTGSNIGLASNDDVYEALLSILNNPVLNGVSFLSAERPFLSSKDEKIIFYINTASNDLPYYFATKFTQKLNNKKRIRITTQNQTQEIEGETYEAEIRRAQQGQQPTTNSKEEDIDAFLTATIYFNDTSLFYSIEPNDDKFKIFTKSEVDKKLTEQNQLEKTKQEEQRKEQETLITQIQQSFPFQSALELTLKTIHVHALNKAINRIPENPDKNIGNRVFVLEMTDPKESTFLKSIFSNGLFTPFIDKLINNPEQIQLPIGKTLSSPINTKERLELYAKYGFVSSLLGNKTSIEQLGNTQVNYKKLLTAFVIPYKIEQELAAGIKTNHPVYIPFGLLLMLLNHICTIYDRKTGSTDQTPLVYIDYNPELNFFLTNPQQLSTDPFRVLIPFEGSNKDYQELFYDEVLNASRDGIKAFKDPNEKVPLFKPQEEDAISYDIQQYCPIKFNESDNIAYRGKLMNILLSVDYIIDQVKQYSKKDGTNNVYLKPFLEQTLFDINKCLGNFNSFRVSYNDSSNTFQIVDDQVVPTLGNEEMVTPQNDQTNITNRTEIPLIGKTSIAKSIDTRTEISSQLGSLLAISANPNMKDKSTLSVNADPIGYLNTAFSDRYVTNRMPIGSGSATDDNTSKIIEAIKFNATITDFYSSVSPSDADVSQVTSYYMERMSKVKNSQTASLAAAMVPIGINFSTDGIGGLNMGQAFTVSNELLPYSYTMQFRPGYIDNYTNYVGFVIVGLNHTIESNQWNTAIRTNMIAVKDKTSFEANPVVAIPKSDRVFKETSSTNEYTIGSVSLSDLNITQNWENIAVDYISKKEGFLEKPRLDQGTLRAGYGTDTIIDSDGNIKKVGSNTVFTKDSAKRTLVYQIKNTFSKRIISQIGQSSWNSLNDRQKASLVSFTYNVGSLTNSIVTAIKSNTGSQAVANAIASGPYTGKVSGYLKDLEKRRKEEAQLYLS
jgi:GH24 family phage-related lysozyme (muramidase)